MSESQELTAEQLAQIEAIKAIAPPSPQDPIVPTLTPTEPVPASLTTPVVTETPTPPPTSDIQPTMPHTETFPVTGESVVEHPAVSLITEIEEHLGLLSMYGSVESHLRSLVAQLKSFF